MISCGNAPPQGRRPPARTVLGRCSASGGDQDAAGAFDLTDDVHDFRDAGTFAALVDDGEVGVEPFRDGAGADHAADIGAHNGEVVAREAFLDILDQDRCCEQVVGRDVEEALDLAGMEIDGQHAIRTRRGDSAGRPERRGQDRVG